VTAPAPPEVLDLGILELSRRIRARSLSPVALVEAALARVDRLAPRLNCFVTVTAELARAQARRAEVEIAAGRWRGPLHGVPYGLKDLVDTKGIRTTLGARPYADRVPEEDATVAARLRDAGAVLVGKLSMIELAGALGVSSPAAALNGACRNPWDLARWAGGSSSGCASAVAAGLVTFAIGTETSGSLTCPAAFCGVTAHRPTYGAVSRHGVMPFAATADKVGPVARSAADCAAVLAAIAGRDPRDPSSTAAPAGLARVDAGAARGLRAAALPFPGEYAIHPSIPVFYEQALASLRAVGIAVERASLPDLPWRPVLEVIMDAEAAVAFEALIRSGRVRELSDPIHRAHGGRRYGSPALATDYVKAQALRAVMQRAMRAFFARYDLVVSPNAPIAPPLADEPLPDGGGGTLLGLAANVLGLPGAAVPMGFVEPGRLPTSLQIAGPPGGDARVLAAAALFQSATRWHLARPLVT
jgi:aspartyl-tRNA(Asn)/glutamyl-tRNA(Gln) amidotransferase subunit A